MKNVKPPPESTNHRPSVLAVHQGSGVTKKSKHGRKSVLSARAKRRQEKGLDRAEAVMDKKEKKIEVSKGRARTGQERSKAWEELNRKMLAEKAQEEALALDKENWIDEDGEEDGDDKDLVDGSDVDDGEFKDTEVVDAPVDASAGAVGAEDLIEDEIL